MRIRASLNRTWLQCLILTSLGFVVRMPALQGELIWDDFYLTRDNPFIKSPLLVAEAFRHYLFPAAFGGHYRPVQTISYVFDYWLWNTDTAGYHLSNLFWHIGSGVLLYLLLHRLLRQITSRYPNAVEQSSPIVLRAAAFFIALLWIVHPVHSAAVDYISGRADSLVFFFACGAWLLFLRTREMSRKLFRYSCYLCSGLLGLLALCSRETGLLWLLIFLLYLFIFDRTPVLKSKLVILSCCLVLVAFYGALRAWPEYRPINSTPTSEPAATRAVLMFRALGDYGRLMIWPANLHMERDVAGTSQNTSHWRQAIGSEYLSIAGLLVVAALAFGTCRKGAFQAVRVFGTGWFVITYLPISNLIQLNATVAEHWLYLPSVGLLIFLAGCCLEFPQHGRRIAAGLACLAVVGLGARSFVRSSDWVTEETFYRRTLLSGGDSVRIGVNLAAIYSKRGENAKAENLLRKVLQVDPTYLVARNNLGALLSDRGETAEAERIFDSTSKEKETARVGSPRNWAAALNLAHLAHARHDDAAALALIDKARCDYSGTWELVRFEAELLRRMKGPETALPIVEEFARDHSWHCEAYIALGRLYCEVGDIAKAGQALRHASWLDVHDAEALSVLAELRMRQNRLGDALQTQRRAVARQPDQPRQYLLLSVILEKMNRPDEARAAVNQVDLLQALAKSQGATRAATFAN